MGLRERGLDVTRPILAVLDGIQGPEAPVPEPAYGSIRRRPVRGGLINDYEPLA